jgi:hypothetical protein
MSVVISKGESICRNPTNDSKSKQLYSFAKSKRFNLSSSNISSLCNYNINRDFARPSFKNKIKTTFGIERPDIFYLKTKESLAKPSPVHYNILSSTDSISKRSSSHSEIKKPATTFGTGREAYSKVVSANKFCYEPFNQQHPGPTTYKPDRQLSSKKFSIRTKIDCDSKLFNPL